MKIRSLLRARSLISIAHFAVWTALFSISYSQSPLYSSSQNQYFLHGLARGGLGLLQEDWLANTADPTPVFSLLASITFRSLHESFFYLYYCLIFGIYLFSLIGIASRISNVNSTRPKYLTYLALMLAMHSAAAAYLSSKVLGVLGVRAEHNLRWFLLDGLAAQSTLESIFQPSTFGVLMILSLYIFLMERPLFAVLPLALAATFHPAYLLTGGIFTLSYMVATFRQGKRIKRPLLVGLLTLLLVLPMLTYIYIVFRPTSPETWRASQEILVRIRIPWHAVPRQWLNTAAYLKILIVFLTLYLIRRTKLFLPMLLSTLFASTLTIVQISSNSDALALLFPWRASVILIPISTSIIAAHLMSSAFQRFGPWVSKNEGLVKVLSLATVFAVASGGAIVMKYRFESGPRDTSRPMMDFVKRARSPGMVFLIPPAFKTFRLYTGVPILIDFESVPYKDSEVVEWYKRLLVARKFYEGLDGAAEWYKGIFITREVYEGHDGAAEWYKGLLVDRGVYGHHRGVDCRMLDGLSKDYAVTHVVIANIQSPVTCAALQEVYKDAHYRVYRIIVNTWGNPRKTSRPRGRSFSLFV